MTWAQSTPESWYFIFVFFSKEMCFTSRPGRRGKTAVYWATLSHSTEVLEELCGYAQKEGIDLDVSLADHSNSSPLDVAVASQQWKAVKILIQLGGLKARLCRSSFRSLRSHAHQLQFSHVLRAA
jgi:hypothetical protein